jgi:RNA polymerase sigma-70 factor (ECF subfamily)
MELAKTLCPQHYGLNLSEGRAGVVVDPDGELVVRIAAGDHTAARALMGRHLPRILNLSRRMLGNQAEAEDVAQEVFLRVWTHAARWKPGAAKFETWLHRVAINLCYDQLRKKRPTHLDAIAEPVDPAPGPAASLFQSQVSAAVEAALEELPERQREAIVLCHHQGLTNIDAAEVMGVSVEALESLLSRGRRTLKERLKELRADVLDAKGGA